MKLPLSFGSVSGEIKTVPDSELRAVKDFKDAIRLCIKLAPVRRTQNDLAALIGVNATQFSKVLNGSFHLPGDAITELEKVCQNTAITQYQAAKHGATLHFKTPQEIIEEQAREIEQLKRRVA